MPAPIGVRFRGNPPGGVDGAPPGSVVIVRLQADNEFFLADEDGDFNDWFELANTTGEAIDLSGWVVIDDNAIWVVPDGVSLAAAERLIRARLDTDENRRLVREYIGSIGAS